MEDVADEHKIAFDVFERESEEDGTVDISSLPDLLRKVSEIVFALERHNSIKIFPSLGDIQIDQNQCFGHNFPVRENFI